MKFTLKKHSYYELIILVMKIFIAFIVSKIKLPINRKYNNIWLLGGNMGARYEDNSAVFHKYLVENQSEYRDYYWLYDKKVFNNKDLKKNGVALGSFKNYLLFFYSDKVIYSHSLSLDIAPYINKFLFLNKVTKKIHISHGVEGFKKMLLNKKSQEIIEQSDYINCISSYEKEIKETEWGVSSSKLMITGMPRFDVLENNKRNKKKIENILMFFTWREWLIDLDYDQFKKTKYFSSIINIIQNSILLNYIKQNNIKIKFVFHPFMIKFIKQFTNEYLENKGLEFRIIRSDEVSLQDEVLLADLLITDYSSISWDFYYMNKPIIFYQFDMTEYLEKRGSYLDITSDVFGYRSTKEEDIVGFIKKIIDNHELNNCYYKYSMDYFDFIDNKNCLRLFNKINRLPR